MVKFEYLEGNIRYLMPVWNLYFCMDVKLGLLQAKSSVKYKLLWIDVYDIY